MAKIIIKIAKNLLSRDTDTLGRHGHARIKIRNDIKN